LKMSHGFCNTSDVVNNDVQVEMAAGSHHLPNRWPWPTRWAGAGTSCRQRRGGYGIVGSIRGPDNTGKSLRIMAEGWRMRIPRVGCGATKGAGGVN